MVETRNLVSHGPRGAGMQRQLLIALGGGFMSAMLSFGLLAGAGSFALIAYFAPLPLFAAGFAGGVRGVALGGLFATVVLGLLGGSGAAAEYAASIMLPCWIVVYHMLSHRLFKGGVTGFYTPGDIVARLSVLGAIVLVMIFVVQSGNEAGIEASVRHYLQDSLAPFFPAGDTESSADIIDRLAPLFPAYATLLWLAMLVVNATLAQALLTRAGMALRASPDYSAIEAPEWSYWLLVGAASLKLGSEMMETPDLEFLAQNLTVILAAPFFFVGLGVVHSLSHRLRFRGAGLAVFYMFLMVFAWFAAVVATLGFTEQWTGLRGRFAPPSPNQSEDE